MSKGTPESVEPTETEMKGDNATHVDREEGRGQRARSRHR